MMPRMDASNGNAPIRILLIDDHTIVRKGIRDLLETQEDFTVVGEAGSGETGFRAFAELQPDLVILDLNLPGENGLATLRRMLARDQSAKILILSMHHDLAFVTRALDYGAAGYLSKDVAHHELIKAVNQIACGTPYIEQQLLDQLHNQTQPTQHPSMLLSAREFEVFCLLARGESVNEIAELLHLSSKTVGAHHTSIMKKLQLKNGAQLVRTAIVWGVIPI